MKHKFSSFLTHKGRWFLATLTLLFTLSIGQMWGDVVSKNTSTTGTIIYSNINSGSGNVSISAGNEENGFAAVGSDVSFKKGPDCISVPNGGYFMVCVDDITSGTISMTMAKVSSGTTPDWSSTSGGSDDRYFQLYVDDTAKKKFLYSKYSASAVLAEPDVTGLTYENSKIRGLRQFDFTASDLTTVSTKKYLKFKALGGEMKPYGIKIVQAATPSASPTIGTHPSTSAAQYVKDATATALSVSATGSGTLTYQWYSNTTASNTSGSAIDGATSASYTPSTAAVGTLYYYCAVTNTESGKSATTVKSNVSGAITVILNPVGSGHVLTWNLTVRESSSGESTLGTATTDIGTSSKSSTSTYLTNQTDLTGVGVKRTTDGKSNNTGKIETPASYDGDKYVSYSFNVASGYMFTPSAVSIKTVAVSAAKDLKFEFNDANGSYSVTKTNLSTNGTAATNNLDFSECDVNFTGTVTVKMYVYGATNQYRLSTPLTITGTVAAAPSPEEPTITAPTADQSAVYSLGATIEPLTITATGYPAPTYQWYKNATATATVDNEHKISGATNVSYTPANDVASDFYYYCVATNASGSATSHLFHVTVNTCTKPGTPANLAAADQTLTAANLSWNAAANSDGYKVSIIKKSDESVIVDWTDNATTTYAATGLASGTAYTFKVKAVGATGYCEYGDEATLDFSTVTPTVADLVTIADDYTFTPSATLTTNTLYEEGKIISLGGSTYSNGLQLKTNRQIAFKVNANAKIKVTFNTKDARELQIGTTSAGTDLAHSASSPINAIREEAGVVYLSASSDLYMTKLEIFYPHTVTYALNGGTGTLPTESAHYVGDKFTTHNGETGISAPATKEFDKWKDQDNADVAGGAEYTMPAKAVTLTAQWRAETVKYAVTYDLDDYTSGVAPTETNKAEGDVFAIKAAPSRVGYAFLGWLCDIDAQTYQATDDYTMTAAATTFTAVWKQEFQVTFNLQGHGDPIAPQVKLDGAKVTKPADPTEMLYDFGGWYKEAACTNAWDFDNDVVTEDTELFAKWTEFDGCAYLAPVASGDEPSANDAVLLKSSSFGGTAKVVGKNGSGSITYTENGLSFTGGSKDSIRVTLNNQMQVGTTISVRLVANGTNARGLKLSTLSGTEKATLGFGSGTQSGDVGTFSYTVTADDGLDGKKAFRLSRSNSIYLKYITVEDCAPQDFTVTYKDGSTTMGTESVFENAHPTATGIATRKNGYVFQGWSETNGGDVVDLDDITITADKTLYAKYTERVCATSGSMFKFQMKTDLTNGNVFASTPNSVAATTDNYLAELAGGDVTFAVTGSSNNNLLFYDQKSIGFANGSQGRITINLDCPLAANDVIRFVNYAASGQKARLSDGSHNLNLDGNGAETVQQIAVPADFVGAYELTITRANNTPKITSFEIYRCPALTGVALEDMTMRTNQSIAPQITFTPADALVTSQAWEITDRTGASEATINATTGVITSGTETGTLTVQVTVNGSFVQTCTVTIINIYTSLVPVTGTTTWNWAGAASSETKINDVANRGVILANYINGANFEKLEGKENERAYRSNTYPGYQGTQLHFVTTVPGMLKITARNSGSGQRIAVNTHEVTTSDLTDTPTEYSIVVPSGDVYITATGGEVRIYSMIFDTNLVPAEAEESFLGGYERTVNPQYYGTICLPKAGVMTGAMLFQVAYMDYKEDGVTPYKVYYDEVENGTMQAGMPYIFLAEQSTIGVYYTGTAEETAKDHNGLHGTLENMVDMSATGIYMLYNNQVLHSTNPASNLPANRAYLKIDEIPGFGNQNYQAPAPKFRRISTGFNAPQIATGIDAVETSDAPRKIMIDGTMYILRGEKMYDATGRLVK